MMAAKPRSFALEETLRLVVKNVLAHLTQTMCCRLLDRRLLLRLSVCPLWVVTEVTAAGRAQRISRRRSWHMKFHASSLTSTGRSSKTLAPDPLSDSPTLKFIETIRVARRDTNLSISITKCTATNVVLHCAQTSALIRESERLSPQRTDAMSCEVEAVPLVASQASFLFQGF